MRKAIVTGATGFIGRHLIKRLAAENWMVYAVTRKEHASSALQLCNEQIKWISMDMSGYSQLDEIIKESCDAYVSLAWDGTRGQERADALRQEKNYWHSMEALEAVGRIGCRTVISAGSQAEYGPMQGLVDENTVCKPNTEYGKWKFRYFEDGMKFCKSHGILWKEPRFFSLYGEDDNGKTMILSVLNDLMKNRPCRLTECIQLWDFLHVEDAVDGVFRLMDMECEGGAYNFGSGDIRMLKDFVMEMYKMTNSRSRLLFGAVPYPETGMVNVCPDTRKLQEQTGWHAKINFSDGIRRIIEGKRPG